MTVGAIAPDTRMELGVLRDGKKHTLVVTSGERPKGPQDRLSGALSSNQKDEGVLDGVTVNDLDDRARDQMNIPARLQGAVITSVDPESAAARSGLKAGDVILEINKQPVTSAEDAVALSTKAEGKRTLLRLWSRGSTLFVVVDESGSS